MWGYWTESEYKLELLYHIWECVERIWTLRKEVLHNGKSKDMAGSMIRYTEDRSFFLKEGDILLKKSMIGNGNIWRKGEI